MVAAAAVVVVVEASGAAALVSRVQGVEKLAVKYFNEKVIFAYKNF